MASEKDSETPALLPSSAGKVPGAHTSETSLITVPRRGFLRYGPEVELTRSRKAFILILAAFSGMLGPLGGFIYSPALALVQADLHATELLANMTLTVYSLALGVSPLVWATMADVKGRRPTLLLAALVMLIGSLGCWLEVLSPNVGVFLFWRIVFGAGSCAGLSVGAGIIADIYSMEERGRAYGLFFLGPILGPVISPPIGGAVAQALGWRNIFLLTTVLALLVFLASFFFLPETLVARSSKAPTISRNPLAAFVYLRYPFVSLPLYMTTIAFASFISFSPLVPRDWPAWYGFSTTSVGFVLMSMGAGMAVGSATGGWYSDWNSARWQDKRCGVRIAEDRMWSSVPGIILMNAAQLAYGWFNEYRVAWPANIVMLVLFGIGQSFIMTSLNTYLMDIFQSRAASVSALGNFLRFTLSSFMPIVVVPAASIGRGWFYTILTILNLLGLVGVGWSLRYGTRYRFARQPWRDLPDAGDALSAVGRKE
ncbi:Dityrosine transporter 1 [Gonapodya sp. JEL0774]|nr:Dityrosine transporter 1 [Gonapodya sp. JEL0774]